MNILSIDIEEWYTYELYPKGGSDYYLPIINKYLESILDLLDENNIKCTFFCLGVIARQNSWVIRKIHSRGHDIGCHSDIHQLITDFTPEAFNADTRLALDSIENIIGEKVTMYRAPAFSITEQNLWALDVLVENGILYDSSIFPANRRFGGFPALDVKKPFSIHTKSGNKIDEFPIGYVNLLHKKVMFSGGGYFRFMPYWLTKQLTCNQDYNLAYFHIRDMDRYQKIVPSVNYFYSYYGIKQAYNKFENYIKDFDFISFSQAIKTIDWASVPVISL